MPRVARVQSTVDLYHVMVRGINQVQLFYDDADRRVFLDRVWQYRDICGIKVLSWCLMANHVHLLVEADINNLSQFMKRLQLSYSHYYSRRYDRTGYLFQGRYHSVAIESEGQLLNVIRYIHRNPLEVGADVRDWTSYDDIESVSGNTNSDELLQLIDGDQQNAVRIFTRLVQESDENENSPSPIFRRRLTDEEASQVIIKVAGTETCQGVCELTIDQRDATLIQIKAAGPTVRQIARLTGLNRGVVQRAGASRDTSSRHSRHFKRS